MNTFEGRSVSLLFAGDCSPCRRYEAEAIAKGTGLFGDATDIISQADISFINLECPLTVEKAPIEKDGPNLKAAPETAEILRNFTLVGLANNHIMDFGAKGLEDTIKTLRSLNIATVGAGSNIHEASQPFIATVKGLRVAILAFAEREFNQATAERSGAAPLDPVSCLRQVVAAKRISDLLIVTIHGGNEFFPYPRPKFRDFCRFLIEQGASAVVCHHPHVPGACEFHNDCPIFYSIGNVIFDSSSPKEGWWEGFFVKLDVDLSTSKVANVDIIPYRQHPESGGLRLLNEIEVDNFNCALTELNATLADDGKWLNAWRQFVRAQSSAYLTKQYSPVLFRGIYKLSKFFKLEKALLRRSDVAKKLNLIQCDAHKDLLEELLRNSMPPRPK